MLDIFQIADSTQNHDNVDETGYLGSLSMVEFKSLDRVFEHPNVTPLNFFEDTRLTSTQAKKMYETCIEHHELLQKCGNFGNTMYANFAQMLKKAVGNEHGIVAFCD